ncbi:MAG: CRISPR-associated protein Cas4 [Hadesarchaea archaeon]|nr:CRISPR-associated protein Cas4 [Hadesarchaea archaeon]
MERIPSPELTYTGTQVNYYFVCKRKLWLFSRNFEMEQTSDLVSLGSLLHEVAYSRKTKEIDLGPIKIDFLSRGPEVHDIKRSKRIEAAHIGQMLYYLYWLKRRGIVARGVIDYPLLRRRQEVKLTAEREREVERTLEEIKRVLSSPEPPPAEKKSYCRKCSYYELCWC